MERLRDTPQSLGLPTIERFRVETSAHHADVKEEELSQKEMLVEHVLKNRYVWFLAFAYFFVYVIRTVINDWGQLYLYEYKQFSLIEAGSCIFSFEIGGFFGCLAAYAAAPTANLFSCCSLASTTVALASSASFLAPAITSAKPLCVTTATLTNSPSANATTSWLVSPASAANPSPA